MLKGRRTRNAGKIPAKTFQDDTASPKRKDIKYASTDNNLDEKVTEQLSDLAAKPHVEPMKLRGGRKKSPGISQYLQQTTSSRNTSSIGALTLFNNKPSIEVTDENTCDSFDIQLSNANGTFTATETMKNESVGARSSKTQNKNIFLQDPVLTLNFAKVSNPPSRTLKMMQNSFLTNTEINLFTSPSQPKIESFWKDVSIATNKKCVEDQQQTAINQHILDLSKPTQVTQIDSTTTTENMLQEEGNSCDSGDSGVVILPGSDGNGIPFSPKFSAVTEQTTSAEKRKKPATPHRILCPSPVKNAIVYLQSPPGLLNTASLESSKSKKHAAVNKSRKRLNVKDDKSAPMIGHTDSVQDEKSQNQSLVENQKQDHVEEMNGNMNNNLNRQLIVTAASSKSNGGCNKKITEFYPIRRSVRKTKKEVQVERDRDIERAIHEGREDGLKIEHFEGKGRGIVTTRSFSKGEFVVEYIGDLISVSEAKKREQTYAKDDNTGCYMYYFRHKNLQHCIDATAESGKLGRLVNHSRNGNLVTKTVPLNDRPHLVLIAKEDIEEGVEITYDYGDRSKEALQHYPWLAL
uniref:[histone H4]-lysine(20) N-methyltransferase n=1 Tax=Anopheles farauti TaxID=69004 RepID=A0A182Q8L8_9DIPT